MSSDTKARISPRKPEREDTMAHDSEYIPPTVWEWDTSNGGRFANINRPISGATHERTLPRGEHPLQLYSLGTPNGQKVTILLEELLALGVQDAEYDAWYVDILSGEQFGSDFVAINPNSKIPALLDYSETPAQRVFESGAILMYLAEKFGCFLPTQGPVRTETLNWLFWLQGAAPYLGGGFGHFYAYAPTKMQYPIDRFTMETKRQMHLLDEHLARHAYLAGDDYTIADIATWPWYGALAHGLIYDAGTFLQVEDYTHLRRWANTLAQRPAVKRGRIVNRSDAPDRQLKERHSAQDFERFGL